MCLELTKNIVLNVKISKESLGKYWVKLPKALISLIYFFSTSKTIDLEVETTVDDSNKSINIPYKKQHKPF